MNEYENNHVLFEKSVRQINLDAKILRENTHGSKTGSGKALVTRRPASLDPRFPEPADKGSLEELIKIQSQRTQKETVENAQKRELEDVVRAYQNRSLSPSRLVGDRLERASKRTAEDSVRRTQNRSLSPQFLQRVDSKSKVVGDEFSEYIRYQKEKNDISINLPAISTSPILNNLIAKNGINKPSYNKENKFTPTAFQAFQSKRLPSESEYGSSPELGGSRSPGFDADTDEEYFDKNVPISQFPYVEDNEIMRHRKLNLEAEKKAKKKSSLSKGYLDYLQRLKLSRRAIEKKDKDAKDAKNAKKKTTLKAAPLKPKLALEPKIETPPPEIPRKSIDECIKLGKVIQSFRYSYAIEDYFKNRSRRSFDSVAESDRSDDELKNGWLIKTLGAQVLNVEKALPSCNPFEVRKRRQMLRERAAEETRLLRRRSTHESIISRSSRVHFMEPVSRLQSIYERHGSIHSDAKSETGVSEKELTPRYSISERKESIPESGILVNRRKSSVKVKHDAVNSDERTELLLDMAHLSADS